jgi:hypothetical protein
MGASGLGAPPAERTERNAMPKHLSLLLAAAVLGTPGLTGVASAASPDQADAVEVMAHDVYVVLGTSLRSAATLGSPPPPDAILHNVAGLQLPAGAEDPLTRAEWSAATATSRVASIGGPDGPRTDVRVSMQSLVPGGVYSIFWFTVGPDSEQPLCPGVERRLPLDAAKPDPAAPDLNSFVAGANGAAEFHGRVGGDLLGATQLYLNVVYHADGLTYYPFPNRGEYLTQGPDCRSSFGHDAIRHLLIYQKI